MLDFRNVYQNLVMLGSENCYLTGFSMGKGVSQPFDTIGIV